MDVHNNHLNRTRKNLWNTESVQKNRAHDKICKTAHGSTINSVAYDGSTCMETLEKLSVWNTLWSQTARTDHTTVRKTHASLNVTPGGKKKPCRNAWWTALAVTHFVAHLRCRRYRFSRIRFKTSHRIPPRTSTYFLGLTHPNLHINSFLAK